MRNTGFHLAFPGFRESSSRDFKDLLVRFLSARNRSRQRSACRPLRVPGHAVRERSFCCHNGVMSIFRVYRGLAPKAHARVMANRTAFHSQERCGLASDQRGGSRAVSARVHATCRNVFSGESARDTVGRRLILLITDQQALAQTRLPLDRLSLDLAQGATANAAARSGRADHRSCSPLASAHQPDTGLRGLRFAAAMSRGLGCEHG